MSEESVYSLIPRVATTTARPAMYRSKYPATTPPSASTFGASATSTTLTTNIGGQYDLEARNHRWKQSGATFGPKNTHFADPTNFQKKQSQPELPQPNPFNYTDRRKPDVATYHADALSKEALGTSKSVVKDGKNKKVVKNFITENALAVIMAEARKPHNTEVNYLQKDGFGEVPSYLSQVTQEIAAEREYIKAVLAREREEDLKYQPQMRLLPEEERIRIVTDLKRKWEAVNKEYQTITHLVTLDTLGKVRRKEAFETQLQMLERSIEKLSKKFVLVRED